MKRVKAIMHKEFLHIFRDRRSLVILFIMPVFMMILFGYAVRLDIKNIQLIVWDQDRTESSRELIRAFQNTGYFNVIAIETSPINADEIFRNRAASAMMTIPSGFSQSVETKSPVPLQFLTDASDSNTATIAGQYAEQIILTFWLTRFAGSFPLIEIRSLVLFNPRLESTYFIVPGLVAILFMMICALLTSVTIAREKEFGTMEQMLVSPVRVREIIIGKLLPYAILSSILGVMVILLAKYWFGVPFVGSPVTLAAVSFIYILCALSIGMLISTRAKTMQIAMMLALIATMLPSVMLSGFMFPIASMPKPIQILTHIVPARYYLIIIRAIMLKGAALATIKNQVISMGILTAILLAISIRRFKASLE